MNSSGPSAGPSLRRSRWAAPALVGAALLVGGLAPLAGRSATPAPATPAPAPGSPAATKADAGAAYGQLPLRFEPNRGQSPAGVQYLVRGAGYGAALRPDGATFELPAQAGQPGAQLHMDLSGAQGRPAVRPGRLLPGVTNYLRGDDPGRWLTGIPNYGGVRYAGVYPGVDLVYHSRGRQLEYDFVVAPGADPGRIALNFGTVAGVIDGAGDLVLTTPVGEVRHQKPVAYQERGGRRQPVEASFVPKPGGDIGFRTGAYDTARPLVIDPVVVYSTLLGGFGTESAAGTAVDAAGNAYVTGQTSSGNFAGAGPGGLQGALRGGPDAFVAKLNPAGTALVYSTYLGGDETDAGTALAVDGGGSVFVTGTTTSTNFPTVAPPQAAKGAGTTTDAFVAKLNPAGTALTYATYLGGELADGGRGIAVDGAGNAYVTGETASTAFPTAAPFQAAKGAGTTTDAFVTKVSAAGDAFSYSTYLGGDAADGGRAIAVNAGGTARLTGDTLSTNFPIVNPFQATNAGDSDAFVTAINTAGSALPWSTYLGGAGSDSGRGIALDATGSSHVVGITTSDNFPTTSGFQSSRAGGEDGFVTKLVPPGTSLIYSTYLGGLGPDQANGVAIDPGGSAHVVGTTSSSDFPSVEPIAFRSGSTDAFVAQVANAGTALVHASPLGGGAGDSGLSIAVVPSGSAIVGGSSTFFNDVDFPAVAPFQPLSAGATDAFLARVDPAPAGAPLVTGLSPRSGPAGTSVVISGSGFTGASAVRFGSTPATSFTVVSASEVRAVAPASAATIVPVTVTTPGGTSPPNPVTRYTYGEGTWELTGAQVQARVATRSVLMADGRVLLVGGRDRQGGQALTTAEVYDPRTGQWAPTGSMAAGRTAHTATLLPNGKVLVTGGATGDSTANAQPQLSSAELYDPATGTWSPTGDMSVSRYLHTAILLRTGQVLVAGGRTCASPPPAQCDFTSFTASADLYDPATGTFTPTGAMSNPRHTTDSTMLNDGRVLVPAGFGGPGTGWDTADVYDPATGTWTATGPLSIGRSRQGAVTLPDGRAIIANGFSGSNSAELYDPATNNWTLTDSPNSISRNNHFFGLVPNGRVLLAGGGPGGASAEVYDPVTERWRSAGTPHVGRGIAGTPYNTVKPIVLSSDPNRLELDPAVCGNNCGKVLLAGESEDRRAELYVPAAVPSTGAGYWLAASDGGVFAFGGARFFGSTGALRLNRPVVGMAPTPTGQGYWLVASDGGVFAFGDARFFGSTGALRLNRPIVALTPTPSGQGYWLVASDGGVFAFGDARFLGSTGALRLNQPVVGMAPTRTGQGYWLVAADGGIFAFGDARFFGSTGALRLNRPVVAIVPTATSRGYALVASDGGVFAFGDATFRGSTGALRLNQPIVSAAATPSLGPLNGYWLVASDGGVFAFGDAPFLGSTGAIRLNRPIVSMAARPTTP